MLNTITTIGNFAIAHHGQAILLGVIGVIGLGFIVWDISTSKGN